MGPELLYVSPRSGRSVWQEYRVYSDRIELECRLAFRTLVVPADALVAVEVRPPPVFADVFRGRSFPSSFALKLDWADLHPHVAIERSRGFMKHLRLTPDDPDEFVRVCRRLLPRSSRSS